jgi:cytidylate kinase
MINANLDRCLSFINSQGASASPAALRLRTRRAVTISRQAGCGGLIVAQKLAQQLQQHSPSDEPPWTVFDRDLMLQVLADHQLPAHLAQFLPEGRMSMIEDTLADIFGVRPTAETLIQQTAETILKFAELGNVILVGRAGNIVTAKLPHVLHIRLVAPLEDRTERIARDDHKSLAEAHKFCLEEEQNRARYVKTYFNADINDPMGYHMVINTSRVGYENAAKLAGDAVLRL